MKNFKKLFAVVASVLMLASVVPVSVLGATSYSTELQGAYSYAYDNGITTQSSIDTANMYGTLTRVAMAKMMANYAMEVLGQTPDTSKSCTFDDVSSALDAQYDNGVTKACQLGLMGVGIEDFNPNGLVTRAQFGTVLDRAINPDVADGVPLYYTTHLASLNDAGIMNDISNPNQLEIRGYVMLMMERAAGAENNPAICDTPENTLSCSLGLSTCPAECVTNVVTNGNLDVSLKSSVGGDIPYGISSLNVATYKFTADQDISLNSLTFKQLGFSDADTISSIALFINGARVSKTANIDDETTLNLTNSYEIKAGETVNVEVHAAVPNVNTVAGDQFSLKLLSVESSAKDVNYATNLTSATYTILNHANDAIGAQFGSDLENPKVGATAADLFDYKLTNQGTSQDVTLNAITFKGGDSDYGTYFKNFQLVIDDEVVATTPTMNGKYLSFNLPDGYLIKDDNNTTMTVRADVIGGAGEGALTFTVESAMDIVALGDKYDVPMGITFGADTSASITVAAGKVTITRTNTPDTNFVGNTDNILLGTFTITNNAGGNLTLNDFNLTFSTGTSTIFELVKVRYGSPTAPSYELDGNVAGTSFTGDTEKTFGSSLVVYVYGNTIDTGMDGKSFYMTLNHVDLSETANDNALSASDITYPSHWTTMYGKAGSLTLTQVTLGPKGYSDGSSDVEALSFKLKAGSSYGVKVKNLTFLATGVSTTTVRSATLYNGTEAIPATVRNGSILVTEDITVPAGDTSTFMLKVDLATNAVTSPFQYYLLASNIDAVDTSADQNVVHAIGTVRGRVISIEDEGTVTFDYDSSIANNKYAKSILAGSPAATVAEYNLYSTYEAVNVKTATVTFSDALQDASSDIELRYNGEMIANNPTWTSTSVAAFTEIDGFDTKTTETPFLVKVVSNAIDENGGVTVKNVRVDSIALTDAIGKDSGNDITIDAGSASSYFDIVPVTIVTSLANATATSIEVTATAARGTNTTSTNVSAKAYITGVLVTLDGNNGGLNTVTVKDDANNVLGTWANLSGTANGTHTIAFSSPILATTTLRVLASQTAGIDNPSYTLSLNGVSYYTNVDTAIQLSDRATTLKTLISK